MTDTKQVEHTPGPWAISGPWDETCIPESIRICSPNYAPRQYVADVYTGDPNNGMDFHRQESLANARLIAAAPELLEALQAALAELDTYWKGDYMGRELPMQMRAARKDRRHESKKSR